MPVESWFLELTRALRRGSLQQTLNHAQEFALLALIQHIEPESQVFALPPAQLINLGTPLFGQRDLDDSLVFLLALTGEQAAFLQTLAGDGGRASGNSQSLRQFA